METCHSRLAVSQYAPPPRLCFFPQRRREERLRAQSIIAKLFGNYASLVELTPYFWESEPWRAGGHFQDEIDSPLQHDIVVLVLWSRLGTPLPVQTALRTYCGIDGHPPVTSTE
ncbi:hypothetical protein MSPGM_12150 [Methylorubrum sp. GM97]|nr:hypothetical protein MSPGM_12150 [Methylorubrum sp. GM97]